SEAVDGLPAAPQADAGAPEGSASPADKSPLHSDGGATCGTSPVDAGQPESDGGATYDGGTARDAGTPIHDGGPLADAGAAPHDGGASVPDAGTACVPTRTACNQALECGHIPDGCGGFLQCIDCGDGSTWCQTFPQSQWQLRVYNCVQAQRTNHPEWF